MSERKYNPENAEFNQKQDFDFTLFDKLLPNFDFRYKKNLMTRMIEDCTSIQARIERLSFKISSKNRDDSNLLRFFTIRNVQGDASYFKIKFPMPIIHHIHPAFKHLHKKIGNAYYPGVEEFMPCYLLNFNHVSLSKIGLNSINDSTIDSIGNGIYTKFSHENSGKYAQFSSTNILRLGGSHENILEGKEIIDCCFEYAYWNLPAPHNTTSPTINNLIYHSSSKIYENNVLELNKTLIKIIKIRRKSESLTILKTQNIKCMYADVVILVDDGNNISSEKRTVLLIESLANLFKDGEMFTGLLLRQSFSQPYYSIIIGSVGKKIESNDLTYLISIVMQKRLQFLEENSSITYVDKISRLSVDVSEIIKNNSSEDGIFNSSFKSISDFENNMEKSIEKLFPIYINYDGAIHQLSSTIISFLLIYDPEILQNKNALITIIKILDLISVNSKEWGESAQSQLKISNNASDHLTSTTMNLLIENLPILVNMMMYSRIFSQNY
ncbi:hypothetical protein [Nitrosopumilus sp.]|uniref:hypothetical protein n=1 Tax=Nitrosopumilus sp. TaxID=2024843 RepID=UPI00247BED50|nr:hypothetical protein [Nitrosopumilus sp.]MCV0409375.1 hypothetical protein [Nitrosopumilus sp.]